MNAMTQDKLLTMPGPGVQLKAAREASGKDIATVAADLRLDKPFIMAIENEEWHKLPAPIFVKGYMRNYAKLFGLDTQEIWAAYIQHAQIEETPKPIAKEARIPAEKNHSRLVRWILWLSLLAGAGVLAWWKSGPSTAPISPRQATAELNITTTETETAEQPTSIATAAEAETANTPAAETSAANSDAAEGVVSDTVATTAVTSPTDNSAPAEAESPTTTDTSTLTEANSLAEALETPEPDNTVVVQNNTDAASPETSSAINEIAAAEEASQITASLPARNSSDAILELGLILDADSWAEITDKYGRRLEKSVLAGGGSYRYQAPGPLKVYLGNSPAATVLINGRVYNQSIHNRSNNTARFRAKTEPAAQ